VDPGRHGKLLVRSCWGALKKGPSGPRTREKKKKSKLSGRVLRWVVKRINKKKRSPKTVFVPNTNETKRGKARVGMPTSATPKRRARPNQERELWTNGTLLRPHDYGGGGPNQIKGTKKGHRSNDRKATRPASPWENLSKGRSWAKKGRAIGVGERGKGRQPSDTGRFCFFFQLVPKEKSLPSPRIKKNFSGESKMVKKKA